MKVYFLDIDDCLIKTSRLTDKHQEVVFGEFEKFNIRNAREITQEISNSFNLLFDHHQGKSLIKNEKKILEEFMEEMKTVEKPIIEKFGEVKKWSREVYIYLSAKKYGINLSNTILIDITNTLWNYTSQNASFYPDSLPFLRLLQKNKNPIYLITSSDCRLILDDKSGLFSYNPDYSRQLKLKRLSKFISLGIPKKNIFIADPYDKPNPWIFQEALNQAKKEMKTPFTSIMIGDSLKNDLLPAKTVGIERLVWLKRNSKEKMEKMSDGSWVINSLSQVSKIK